MTWSLTVSLGEYWGLEVEDLLFSLKYSRCTRFSGQSLAGCLQLINEDSNMCTHTSWALLKVLSDEAEIQMCEKLDMLLKLQTEYHTDVSH